MGANMKRACEGFVWPCIRLNLIFFITPKTHDTKTRQSPIHDRLHHGPRKIGEAAGAGRGQQDRCARDEFSRDFWLFLTRVGCVGATCRW